MKVYRERYVELVETLRGRVVEYYGEALVSLVLFGSVARGLFRPDSDIDFLIVAENLPRGRARRVLDFQEGVEAPLEAIFRDLHKQGVHALLSPVIKTPAEVRLGSPLFLDMIRDAKLAFDREGFFEKYLRGLQARLDQMGARKVKFRGGSYWLLKPDYLRGDIIEL